MKRVCIFLLVMLLAVAGCGKKTDNKSVTDGAKSQASETENVQTKADKDIVTDETVLGDYTGEFLSEYVEGGSYYIVQNSIADGETTKVEIAVKGEKTAERIGGQTKIIDGDKLFYVIHDSKAVLTASVASTMKEGITDFINVKTSAEAKSALQSTGEEQLRGENFGFEEFKNADGTVAKYYYDDKTLRYVKLTKADGSEELIEVLEMSTTVPEDIFDVPDGYIVKDLNDLG